MNLNPLIAAGLIAAGIAIILLIKRLLISHSAQIVRITDEGEQLTLNVNFKSFDSQAKREKRLADMFALADSRKAFTFDRFTKKIEEARAEQAAAAKAQE